MSTGIPNPVEVGSIPTPPAIKGETMLLVPEEYSETLNNASIKLSDLADLVMFVAEMLGGEKFELDTENGFSLTITKIEDGQLVVT